RGTDQHINCTYPDHPDKDPSFRLLPSGKVVCTCRSVHSVFDAIMAKEGGDFAAAKIRVARILDREDLVIDPNANTAADQGISVLEFSELKKLPEEWVRSADGDAGPIFDMPARGKYNKAIGIHYKDSNGVRRWARIRVKRVGKKHTLTL